MRDLETEVADKLAEFFSDPIDIPCCYCGASRAVIPMVKQEVIDWLVNRRKKLQENKVCHHDMKPRDIEGERRFSIKARALQEVINYLGQ